MASGRPISLAEATERIGPARLVDTYREPQPGIRVGSQMHRDGVLSLVARHGAHEGTVEGPLGHTIVVHDEEGALYIAARAPGKGVTWPS